LAKTCIKIRSTGKSSLFEAPLQAVSHNFTSDEGVGRFNTNNKLVLLLHDCNIDVLLKGKDCEKLKTLTRSEPTTAKIHSSTVSVPPIHVLLTSNRYLHMSCILHYYILRFCQIVFIILIITLQFFFRNLLDHKFATPPKDKQTFRVSYPSELKPTSKIHSQDIDAVQKRYIECFIRSRPTLPVEALPKCGNFTHKHMVIGLYKQIIRILHKYTPGDFNSPYLYLYPISSLCKNLHLMKADLHAPLKQILFGLIERYGLSENQTMTCLGYLNVKLEDNDSA